MAAVKASRAGAHSRPIPCGDDSFAVVSTSKKQFYKAMAELGKCARVRVDDKQIETSQFKWVMCFMVSKPRKSEIIIDQHLR